MVNPRLPGRTSRVFGRIHWAILAFLGGFVVLILLLLAWFIAPGMAVLGDPGTTDDDRARIAAIAALLLAVLLVILFVGLLLTFRVRRYIIGDPQPRGRTRHTDAWAESARRLRSRDTAADEEP